MTTKYLTGDYPAGYQLVAGYSRLFVEPTAVVGGAGVNAPHFAAIVNHGTIAGTDSNGQGVYLKRGGRVTNGSATNTTSLMSGYRAGVLIDGTAAAIVTNFGTIESSSHSKMGEGVFFSEAGGGTVTNGSASDVTAQLTGADHGVEAFGGTLTVDNFGTISGRYGGFSSFYNTDALITNGSAEDTTALITGVSVVGASTVINFGTITPRNYIAVEFFAPSGAFIAEAGSQANGVDGNGETTLELASGTGSITGLGEYVTIGGSLAMTGDGFGDVSIESGTSWTLGGANTVHAGTTLLDEGALTITDTLTVAGTVEQIGGITLGDTVSADATALILQGGVWEIGSNPVAKGAGNDTIKDYGLLIKNAGTGVSAVDARVFDKGTIEVATGTLDFTQTLIGTGAVRIDAGATFEADRAAISSLTVDFDGGDATLAMRFAKNFAATISGFAASDTFDLLKTKATGASVNASNQLVVVNGTTTVATLQLAGSYAGTIFNVGSDGNGGTNVVIANSERAPSARVYAPSTLLMTMAMAGMPPATGILVDTHDPVAIHPWMLTEPRTHLA